ncbi:MAG: sugar transferase [Nitrospira sp.]|nr:sugar transferase [Nitrospira sp.]
MDLLIRRHGMLVPVEIKSARTFSTEFLKGIERFRQVAPDGRVADGFVLFDGEQRHEIKGCEPSIRCCTMIGSSLEALGSEESTGSRTGDGDVSRDEGRGMLRMFDIMFALLGLIALAPVLLILFIAGWFDTGSPLFIQERVGRHQRPFQLMKFRTMRPGTPSVGTHLADASTVTRWGAFLRRTKLDELPQLWNVLKGEMSLVGPRPCLPNQHELIAARKRLGVFAARPGVTGLAQIQGIDMSTPELLAETDARMLARLGVAEYLGCLAMTLLGKGRGDRIRQNQ